MKILVVEDEHRLADSLRELLEENGFQCDAVYDGETGRACAETGSYALLILDVMLPRLDGCTLARQLRARRLEVPILMLTARSELEDRIAGLNAGADCYLPKPFDTRELLACVNALLRRQSTEQNLLSFGNTTLDLSAAVLRCGACRVGLSARELGVMRTLFQAGEQNVSKEHILAWVWGSGSSAMENHAEVYIGFLRKKLLRIGSNVRITAVRRLGYHLEAPP